MEDKLVDPKHENYGNCPEGKLQPISAMVLMSLLYSSRVGRFDLFKGINFCLNESRDGMPNAIVDFTG